MVGIKKHLNALEEILKPTDKRSGDHQSQHTSQYRNQEQNQNYAENIHTDDSEYLKNDGGYRQSDNFNKSGATRSGANSGDDNVEGTYQESGVNPAAQAACYGAYAELPRQSEAGYGSTGLDQGRGVPDDFGARGGVSSGGVGYGDSTDSGGYGTNLQGDSYSKNNQSGFNNEL